MQPIDLELVIQEWQCDKENVVVVRCSDLLFDALIKLNNDETYSIYRIKIINDKQVQFLPTANAALYYICSQDVEEYLQCLLVVMGFTAPE